MISFDELFDRVMEGKKPVYHGGGFAGTFIISKYMVSIEFGSYNPIKITLRMDRSMAFLDCGNTKERVKKTILESIRIHAPIDDIPLLYPTILTTETYFPTMMKDTLKWCESVVLSDNMDFFVHLLFFLRMEQRRVELCNVKTMISEKIKDLYQKHIPTITP